MPDITLRTIQFQLGTDAVALLLEHDFGSLFANTTEANLRARMVVPGDNWGNDEARAEAQAIVDDPEGQFGAGRPAGAPLIAGKGYVVVLPSPAPAPPAPAPPAPAPPAPAPPS